MASAEQLPTTREAIVFDDQRHPISKDRLISTLRGGIKLSGQALLNYLIELFPIANWLPHYNITWLIGDLIAGITVGCVVVPQVSYLIRKFNLSIDMAPRLYDDDSLLSGMAYAKIATLTPEYGLYTSFVGVFLYCFFATSKDMTIGPTAVMSLVISHVVTSVTSVTSEFSNVAIATAAALVCGIISTGLGLLRLGFIVDFIPNPAIAGFMTGSAITISIGQIPSLLGITGVDSRAAAYLVLINSLKALPRTTLDASMGLTGLFFLYLLQYLTSRFSKSYPRFKRPLFFLNISRNVLLVIFYTAISYGICKDNPTSPPISILKNVPSGFREVHVPYINTELLSRIAPYIPSTALILVLEHVAIAKSFGRVNGYKINPNQELIAIGVTNMIASFFSAYPATGSFSRSAIKSRSGVRTPFAGIFSGVVVILALFVLTPAFYYIPNSALAAVIIHAVGDLIVGPKALKQFWRVNPFEVFIFFVGVIVTLFSTVEWGIYSTIALSLLQLLFRVARPRYNILGRVRVDSTHPQEDSVATSLPNQVRNLYVPIEHNTLKATTTIENPPPGVLIFRFEEALTYPNANYIADKIVEYVEKHTRYAGKQPEKKGDWPWNEAGNHRRIAKLAKQSSEELPVLKALVLDFSGVHHVDTTGLLVLVDLRTQINRYAGREVEWHFAGIIEGDVRRALIAGGFGIAKRHENISSEISPDGATSNPLRSEDTEESNDEDKRDIEKSQHRDSPAATETTTVELTAPYFHVDLDEAVRAAAARTW
ncbi:uncharacterized protein VTP21DRAFT_8187 [Calcarisporiella thermophila]|uniref:uncharacterized protein n=1 Tax=Calcarisporiella thermophila TaxID=911321 RepID=UPI003742D9F9